MSRHGFGLPAEFTREDPEKGRAALCECRRQSGPIEGNGHRYGCAENPRNMPLWRVECIGCGIAFSYPIPADWREGGYVCEACDG